jgi:branched-chain amino acid transport system substrate-binding protein
MLTAFFHEILLGMRLLLAIFVFFAATAAADTPQGTPVRIGAVYGFTGAATLWSAQAKRGIELARDEINATGGVNGRPLEILFEDSATTPAGGIAAFNKLVKINRVDALVGDIFSFVTLPMVPLAQKSKIVLVTPSIFDSDMPSTSEYFFTTCPRKESIVAPVESFFERNSDIKRVAILCADNTWGRTYLDVWRSVATAHGVSVVDENCISDYSSDMRAEILRAQSKRPDAVIVAFGVDRALKRMKELHFHPKVLTTSDLDEAIKSRGLQASEAEGVYFVDWLATESFAKRFKAQYDTEPIMAPQNSYEAVMVLARAFKDSPNDLQKGVSSLNYPGATGAIDFRGTHAGNRGEATLMVVANGITRPVR